jgi:hypothetical protein
MAVGVAHCNTLHATYVGLGMLQHATVAVTLLCPSCADTACAGVGCMPMALPAWHA